MNRWAVATRATRGAGRAIVLEWGQAGWTVVVSATNTRTVPDDDGLAGPIEAIAGNVDADAGRGIPIVGDDARSEPYSFAASRDPSTRQRFSYTCF